MTVPEFVARAQRRIIDGRLGPVTVDLGEAGKWEISAKKVERIDTDKETEMTDGKTGLIEGFGGIDGCGTVI